MWNLPPLVLHPLVTGDVPELSAFPGPSQVHEYLLESRFRALKTHFYVGRDLMRWVAQCADFVRRVPELSGRGIRAESFASLLVKETPAPVCRKLSNWGFLEPQSLFPRSLGLNTLFLEVPGRDTLSDAFLLGFEYFAEDCFNCYLRLTPHAEIAAAEFPFQMYGSGEYIQMLEQEWG